MSTKIFHAWRVPKSKINEVVDIFRTIMWKEVYSQYSRLFDAVDREKMREKVMERDTWKNETPKIIERAIDIEAHQAVTDLVKKVASITARSPGIDLECGLNIWIYKKYAYLKAWGEMAGCINWDEQNFPEWIQDYEYWNNSDQPDNLTQRQWDRRAETWDYVLGSGHLDFLKRKLTHHVFDAHGYSDFLLLQFQRDEERKSETNTAK